MIWTGYVPAFRSVVFVLLLAGLPITASGDTEQPVVGEQKLEVQEQNVATDTADGWKAIQLCFECHDMSEAGLNLQARRPQKKHREVMAKQRPCTECHNKSNVRCCHDNLLQ